MSDTKLNQPGDVVRHELLGSGDWIVVEAAVAGAGKSYCRTYPDAWKLKLRKLKADRTIDWSVSQLLRFQDANAFAPGVVLPYVEPLRQDRLAVGFMQRAELINYLRWMADTVEIGTSLTASIHYEQLEGDEFEVRAAVEYSDLRKQSVMSFVGQRYSFVEATRAAEKKTA